MNLAELQKLGVLEAGDQFQYTLLLAITQMILKPDHSIGVGHQVFLAELDAGVRLVTGSRIVKPGSRKAPVERFDRRHPLVEEVSKEGYNIMAEFEAAVANKSYRDACELIAGALPVDHGEHAFLAGLLHDLGKLLIAVAFPEQWQRIDSFALHEGNPHEKERELLGIGHEELSAMAAAKWQIPEPVREAAQRHHSPAIETAVSIPLSRLVQASDQFVNSLGISVINMKPEGEPALPAFNGHPYNKDAFSRTFQSEWETMSSLCFN